MDLRPVGVNGILAVLGDSISEQTGAQVAALREAIADAHISSVEETIPAYASLLVKYDPVSDRLRRAVRPSARAGKAAFRFRGSGGQNRRNSRLLRRSIRRGSAFCRQHAGLSEKEVVALHSGQPYRIYMLGFLPGFPYLGGLNERLHTPRLSTPRTKIPAGSVGIGGKQTGIYPMESPGGWQLIGRTPLTLFAPGEPLPYAAGDRIRFVPIDEDEFARIRKGEEAKRHDA